MTKKKPSLIEEFERATKGLLFQSESDYPVEPLHLEAKQDGPLLASKVLTLTNHDTNTPIKKVDFEDFFSRLTQEKDWYGDEERKTAKQYKKLAATLKKHLTDISVFKVGETNVDVYVVGKTNNGNIAGITTKAVET